MNLSDIFDFKWWHLFVAFISFYLILLYLSNEIIFTDNYYYTAFGNQLDISQIEKIIGIRHKYAWLSYTIYPVILSIKFTVISLIIYIGGFLCSQNISYKNCLKITLLAELLPIMAALATFIYFSLYTPRTLQDVQSFSPLALTQVFDLKQLPRYLIYPFKLINVFEFGYWIMLALGVSYFIKDSLKRSLALVASSYGVGLFIWVLVVMFLQVQFS